MMKTMKSTRSTEAHGFHAVRFYESERSLAKIVAEFLLEGFANSHPGIVVATPAVRAAIVLDLAGRSVDVVELQRAGQFLLLDSNEQLAAFMIEGQPDPARFNTMMSQAIEHVCRGRTACKVRIFGQMVDVLWRDGQLDAAIHLERLWNQLAHKQAFSLLCGYAMGSFYKDSNFEDICGQHSHVVLADGVARIVTSAVAERQEDEPGDLPGVA
jgi:DcmR-like sensory protein